MRFSRTRWIYPLVRAVVAGLPDDVKPPRLGRDEAARAVERAVEIEQVCKEWCPGGQGRFDQRAGQHDEFFAGHAADPAEGHVGAGDSWVAKPQAVGETVHGQPVVAAASVATAEITRHHNESTAVGRKHAELRRSRAIDRSLQGAVPPVKSEPGSQAATDVFFIHLQRDVVAGAKSK